MTAALREVERAAHKVLPALFDEMNRTGHAGHCILVARVLNLVLRELGVPSEPLAVDYEFANAAAVRQMAQGKPLVPPALLARTGSGMFDGYDHHVITLVHGRAEALLLDPTIIQVERYVPNLSMPPVMVSLPWPRESPLSFDIAGGRLTYFFHADLRDFLSNEQWTDLTSAEAYSAAVLQRMRAER